jgi:hypothetical protein
MNPQYLEFTELLVPTGQFLRFPASRNHSQAAQPQGLASLWKWWFILLVFHLYENSINSMSFYFIKSMFTRMNLFFSLTARRAV